MAKISGTLWVLLNFKNNPIRYNSYVPIHLFHFRQNSPKKKSYSIVITYLNITFPPFPLGAQLVVGSGSPGVLGPRNFFNPKNNFLAPFFPRVPLVGSLHFPIKKPGGFSKFGPHLFGGPFLRVGTSQLGL